MAPIRPKPSPAKENREMTPPGPARGVTKAKPKSSHKAKRAIEKATGASRASRNTITNTPAPAPPIPRSPTLSILPKSEAADRMAPTDLSQLEVNALMDLVQAILNQRNQNTGNLYQIEKGDIDWFLRLVFENWNTRMFTLARPTMRKQMKSDTYLRVGTMNRNLPPSKASKAQQTKSKVVAVNSKPHRQAGSNVFLRPVIGKNSMLGWMWADENGALVGTEYIDIMPEYNASVAVAIARACQNYDNNEMERVNGYNIGLAIYLARQRIILWSRGGNTVTPPDLAANGFEEIRLCTDVITLTFSAMEEHRRIMMHETGNSTYRPIPSKPRDVQPPLVVKAERD